MLAVVETARRVFMKYGAESDWTEWTDLRDALNAYSEYRGRGTKDQRRAGFEQAREMAAKIAEESSYHYHRECPGCGYASASYLHCRHDNISSSCTHCGDPLPSGQAGVCFCNMMVEPNSVAEDIRALCPPKKKEGA